MAQVMEGVANFLSYFLIGGSLARFTVSGYKLFRNKFPCIWKDAIWGNGRAGYEKKKLWNWRQIFVAICLFFHQSKGSAFPFTAVSLTNISNCCTRDFSASTSSPVESTRPSNRNLMALTSALLLSALSVSSVFTATGGSTSTCSVWVSKVFMLDEGLVAWVKCADVSLIHDRPWETEMTDL